LLRKKAGERGEKNLSRNGSKRVQKEKRKTLRTQWKNDGYEFLTWERVWGGGFTDKVKKNIGYGISRCCVDIFL